MCVRQKTNAPVITSIAATAPIPIPVLAPVARPGEVANIAAADNAEEVGGMLEFVAVTVVEGIDDVNVNDCAMVAFRSMGVEASVNAPSLQQSN